MRGFGRGGGGKERKLVIALAEGKVLKIVNFQIGRMSGPLTGVSSGDQVLHVVLRCEGGRSLIETVANSSY